MQDRADRESIADAANPLGMDGIEFIEFATVKPQAFGQVLEMMGFRPVARHRSREVLLYRQGEMNIIINAHASGLPHLHTLIHSAARRSASGSLPAVPDRPRRTTPSPPQSRPR